MSTTRFDKSTLPSRHNTVGIEMASQRMQYYGMGLKAEDLQQPIVGVVSAWDGSMPAGDAPLEVAAAAEGGVWSGGATPRQFATVADGGSTEGLLASRELVADGVELTVRGHCYDALVGIATSELGITGLMMVAARLDLPSAIVPLVGPEWSSGAGDEAMARAAEELGFALPAAEHDGAPALGTAGGREVTDRLAAGAGARSLVSIESLTAAAAAALAAGGGADPLLHLVALAHECGVPLDLEELVARLNRAPALAFLRGSLAPEGALWSAPESAPPRRQGTARVFDEEAAAAEWVASGAWQEGTILVVRGQGPRGGPAMPKLGLLTEALSGGAVPAGALLVTDGRFQRPDDVAAVTAVTPEAAAGGPLARLRDGDPVEVDAEAGLLDGGTDGSPGAEPPPLSPQASRVLDKYVQMVGPAVAGAVTHPGAAGERVRYRDL